MPLPDGPSRLDPLAKELKAVAIERVCVTVAGRGTCGRGVLSR